MKPFVCALIILVGFVCHGEALKCYVGLGGNYESQVCPALMDGSCSKLDCGGKLITRVCVPKLDNGCTKVLDNCNNCYCDTDAMAIKGSVSMSLVIAAFGIMVVRFI